jgi:hypothetical protein
LLEPTEITGSKILCSGANGANSLVRIFDEAKGDQCVHGGKKITTGLDADNDGELTTAEVADTQFWCTPEPVVVTPTSETQLVRIYDENAGEQCANGGKKIATGSDTNGNKLLELDEVYDVQYVCNGANGKNGVDGKNGADGVNGVNGSNAPANKITETLACTGPLENWPDFIWRYKLHRFTNGDVFVSGAVMNSLTTIDSNIFYSSQELAGKLPVVQFVHDVKGAANWGSWSIYLDEKQALTVVLYNDQDLLGTLQDATATTIGWSMAVDKCKKTVF